MSSISIAIVYGICRRSRTVDPPCGNSPHFTSVMPNTEPSPATLDRIAVASAIAARSRSISSAAAPLSRALAVPPSDTRWLYRSLKAWLVGAPGPIRPPVSSHPNRSGRRNIALQTPVKRG